MLAVSKRNSMVSVFVAILVMCVSNAGWARTFLIGPTVAGQDEEFERIANSLRPGDELILRGGTYSQNGRRALTVKGTVEKPIIIRGLWGGERPLLTRPAGDIDRHNNIEFVDCAHLVVRGLRFKGGSCGVRFIRGHHVTFEGCEIFETGNNALTMNSGSCDSFVIRHNYIHDTGLSNRGPTEGEGMYIGSHDGKYVTTNTLIERNYIRHLRSTSDGGNDGIEIKFGSWGNTVRDNVIHGTKYGRKYPGIFVYGGGEGVNIVEGNLIWDAGEGIQVVSDAIVRNNVIVDCIMTGITTGPHAAVKEVRNVRIVNNTIINHAVGVRIRWKNSKGMVFANNAIYCPKSTAVDAAGMDKAAVRSNCVTGRLTGVSVDGKRFLAGGELKEAFRISKGFDLRPAEASVLMGAADSAYVPADDFDYNNRIAPYEVGAYEVSDNAVERPLPHNGGFKQLRDGSRSLTIVKNNAELRSAIEKAKAGSVILIQSGTYEGGVYLNAISGTSDKPIIIKGMNAKDPPVFSGGASQAFHLSDCNHVVLANIVVKGFSSNGINIDDGGSFKTPSTNITVENLSIFETGPKGNHDALKMSGVDDFVVRFCRFAGWGGSGIDMVGCHEGVVTECLFVGRDGFSQSNAVQMKGGSRNVLVERSLFKHVGQRAINCGGSTGLAYFRPNVGDYEAKDITIAGNRFVGGVTPVAWVTCDGGWVHHNTIVFPEKWVGRILQETNDPQFDKCHGGVFEENVIVYDSRVSVFFNIGSGTASETFTFRRNAWCPVDNTNKPVTPTAEKDSLYGLTFAKDNSDPPEGRIVIKDPRAAGMGALNKAPITATKKPSPATIDRKRAHCPWCLGIGHVDRFSHTRSPNVAFDAQLSVLRGEENNRGFNHIQKKATPRQARLHHPRGLMLHTAESITGSPVIARLQTLRGFA